MRTFLMYVFPTSNHDHVFPTGNYAYIFMYGFFTSHYAYTCFLSTMYCVFQCSIMDVSVQASPKDEPSTNRWIQYLSVLER